jgi:hypothetical protein
VEATLGMPEQHVYVANDYPDYSCEYQSVLAHENKHVQINRTVVQSFAEPMRIALQDGVTKINPLIFSNTNVQDSQITGFLYGLMRPTWDRLRGELKRQNGAIDTLMLTGENMPRPVVKTGFPAVFRAMPIDDSCAPSALQKLILTDHALMSIKETLDPILVATIVGREQSNDRIAAFSRGALEHIWRKLQGLPHLELMSRHQ